MTFKIDHRLAVDTTLVCSLKLSQVRLQNNSTFPWIILVPQVHGIKEMIELSENDQLQIFKEIMLASRVMNELFSPDKLNIANLGNVVSQLHIHVIARFKDDKAWPNPVWNSSFKAHYSEIEEQELIVALQDKFKAL